MIVKKAEFVKSFAKTAGLENLTKPQFAFVGRSNVGKSSLLNALCSRRNLAKTSSTPGRTRLVNVFLINDEFYFVDLPGYGFAKASKAEQAGWQSLIGGYLESSENLKLVFVLVDSRHEPTEKDKQMLNYLYAFQIPFKIIATKTDKLKKSELQKNKVMISSSLGVGVQDIIFLSSEKKENLNEVLNLVENSLN